MKTLTTLLLAPAIMFGAIAEMSDEPTTGKRKRYDPEHLATMVYERSPSPPKAERPIIIVPKLNLYSIRKPEEAPKAPRPSSAFAASPDDLNFEDMEAIRLLVFGPDGPHKK